MEVTRSAPSRTILFLFAVVLGFPTAQAGAADAVVHTVPTAVETYRDTFRWRTLGGDFASPVLTDARYALLAGGIVTATSLVFRKQLEEPVNDDFEQRRYLGDSQLGDKLGQLVPNLVYFSSMLGYYYATGEPTALRRSNLMFRATLHSGVATLLLKQLVREGRPYDANEKTSFPSGHASSSFAFAAAVAMEHEWYWGAGAYALATYIGASRINDHKHHLRDVLAGATIGISYGAGIFYRMRSETGTAVPEVRGEPQAALPTLAVLPTDDLSGGNLLWRAEF